ncbi:hypothetical protein HMPREF0880_03700 [Yokenella regensburgei ATCC 43003]|nr:hypothetical protein HMPREF0880_03700 [Yokenella regensburgei ATCC 43003]
MIAIAVVVNTSQTLEKLRLFQSTSGKAPASNNKIIPYITKY